MADAKEVVTVEEVCNEVGFDYSEIKSEEGQFVQRRIIRLIKFADTYLQGAIGENYPREDARAKQMALAIISDLYDYGDSSSSKISNLTKKLLNDLEWQLKTELRRKNAKTN